MFLFFIIIIFILYGVQNILFSNLISKIYTNANNKKELKKNLLFLFIVIGILLGLYVLKYYFEMQLIPQFISNIRQTLFLKTLNNENIIQSIELGKYVKNSGDFTEFLKFIFINNFHEIIKLFNISFLIFLYLLYDYPKFSILFLLCYILFLYFSLGIFEIISLNKKKEDKYSKLTEKMHEKIFNLENIYFNNTLNNEIKKNENDLDNYSIFSKYCYKKQVILFTKILIILLISIILLLGYAYKNYSGQDFILLSILSLLYFNNMLSFSNICYQFSSKLGELLSVNEYFEFIFKKSNTVSNNILKNIHFGKIQIKNMNFTYLTDLSKNKLFNNLNINVNPGEKIFIIGKPGCGKTTFMKLLLQFLKPTEGNIYIDNIPINSISKKELREKIIYMNQKTSLFSGTILENIQYGNKSSKEQIQKMLKKYDLENYFGLDLNKSVGNLGNEASLGMQKMILVLRILLKKNYDTILLDEPTTSLDQHTKNKVMEMIWKETNGKTVFIVSHDIDFIQTYNAKVIKLC